MAKTRPNVILITTDQQRFDSVAMNGSSFMQTPNTDRLGREGVSFSRPYCPSTVCTPSRVSMMTGLHLSRHGAYNIGTYVDDYTPFLSTALTKSGYRTHHIGKAHWHPFWAKSPENQPLDEDGNCFHDFAGFETAEICIGHTTFGVTGHYAHWVREKGFDPSALRAEKLFEDDPNETGDWNLPVELHSGSWLAERTEHFLDNLDSNAPFFLNLGFQDPHHPHVLPSDFQDRLDPYEIPLPDTRLDGETGISEHISLLHDGGITRSRFNGTYVIAGNVKEAWRPYFQDEVKTRATRAYYYSMVQLIDVQLGRILAAVDRNGLAADTLIIFTSDHGEMLGDHAIGQKGPFAYEGVLRIPLLMRYPNGFEPCFVDECVSLVDILPTVLDFAGVEDKVRRDGLSLKSAVQAGKPLRRPGVRVEFKEEPDRLRFKCWVTPEWKLAVYLGEPIGELFDLKNDPSERHNLFHDARHQATKARLLVELLEDMERSEPLYPRFSRA